MSTEFLIRSILGLFLILYGLGFYAYEQFHEMKYIDQHNGVLNSIVCIVCGVLVASFNFKQGIIYGLISFLIWLIERVILNKIMNNKDK